MCTDMFGPTITMDHVYNTNWNAQKYYGGGDKYYATNIVLPNGSMGWFSDYLQFITLIFAHRKDIHVSKNYKKSHLLPKIHNHRPMAPSWKLPQRLWNQCYSDSDQWNRSLL